MLRCPGFRDLADLLGLAVCLALSSSEPSSEVPGENLTDLLRGTVLCILAGFYKSTLGSSMTLALLHDASTVQVENHHRRAVFSKVKTHATKTVRLKCARQHPPSDVS